MQKNGVITDCRRSSRSIQSLMETFCSDSAQSSQSVYCDAADRDAINFDC